jgi:hypothetical protein
MQGKVMHGATDEGQVPTATFKIGLRVGKSRSGAIARRKGALIDERQATDEIYRLRAHQVGRRAADNTVKRCQGRWLDTPEPTLECEIVFFPSGRERRDQTFQKHMLTLGERLAERLGQREIMIHMGGHVFRTNAPRERGPKPLRHEGRIIR